MGLKFSRKVNWNRNFREYMIYITKPIELKQSRISLIPSQKNEHIFRIESFNKKIIYTVFSRVKSFSYNIVQIFSHSVKKRNLEGLFVEGGVEGSFSYFFFLRFLCCLKGQTKLCRKKIVLENINTYSTRQTKRSKKIGVE